MTFLDLFFMFECRKRLTVLSTLITLKTYISEEMYLTEFDFIKEIRRISCRGSTRICRVTAAKGDCK